MRERIGVGLRRAVVERAQGRCEYCGVPDTTTLLPHEPDHIIAVQHGGGTTLENLAYACFECNRFKGPNLTSLDPESGAVTRLYQPRTDQWNVHFHWDGAVIVPLTPTGRATVLLLRLNQEDRVAFRSHLLRQGYVLDGGRSTVARDSGTTE
jgi:hypothetical protein